MLRWRIPLGFLPVPPGWGRALPILVISCIVLVLELSQGCYGLFEMSSMPYGHSVGTHYVRTDPPVVSIDSNFIWSDVVRVILVRQFIHLTTYFCHCGPQFNHVLAELFVSYESVVDTQEVSSFCTSSWVNGRCSIIVIPWLLPVTVPVGSPFLVVVIGIREDDPLCTWTNFLFSSVPACKKCPHVQ